MNRNGRETEGQGSISLTLFQEHWNTASFGKVPSSSKSLANDDDDADGDDDDNDDDNYLDQG